MAALAVSFVVLLVLSLAFGLEVRASREPSSGAAAMEYRVIKWEGDLHSDKHVAQFNIDLNAQGKDGWELVTSQVVSGVNILIYRRPK